MNYFLATTILFTLTATSAFAQESGTPTDANSGTGYVGASLVLLPEYPGSADEDVLALPYLSLDDVKGFDLFATSLSYRAIESGTGQGFGKWSVRAGPSIRYQSGRNSEDSVNLTGFEDVDGSLPIGGYIRSTIGPVGLRLDVGKDVIGGHGGLTADASIGTLYRNGNFAIQPGFTVSWADDKHNDSFFSVTEDQSASSGLARFDAGSGIYSYSASIVSWLEIQDQYAVSLIASYRWYTEDAKDSPILLSLIHI